MIRLVAINSYWFYIIISRKREPKHKWKKFLEGFSNWKIQPGLLLGQNSSNINIGVEQTTYMDPELLGNLVNALKNTPRSNK
jgi:hypothetical protein